MKTKALVLLMLSACTADHAQADHAQPAFCAAFHDGMASRAQSYRAAAREWNAAIGFELLLPECDYPEIDVYPMSLYGDPTQHIDLKTLAGETLGSLVTEPKVQVYLAPLGSTEHAVMIHELGHALGLEHDNDPQSIMHAGVLTGDETISSESVAQLRALWR